MRPITYEEAWVMESRKLSNLGANALEAALGDDGTRPDPYTANKSKTYFAGGELPASHLHSPSADPVRRLAGRAATKAVSRHEAEKSGLVGYAQGRLATVRASLEAYGSGSLAAAAGAGGITSPRSVTGAPFSSADSSPEHAHPYGYHTTTANNNNNLHQPHPANCGCASCGARASHRAAAVDTLAHHGDFMAMHTERLHRALAEPNALHLAQRSGSLPPQHHHQQQQHEAEAALLAGAYSGRYAGSYPVSPAGYGYAQDGDWQAEEARGEEQSGSTEEDSDGEQQRLPAYVLRRYSEVAGVREKTLGRVAHALAVEAGMGGKRGAAARAASAGRQRVLAASQGGVPPTLKEVWGEDPRLAGLVAGAELGPGVAASARAGPRGTLSQRVLEALKQRVGDAADRAAMREVDPDDDSAPSDPDEAAAEADAGGTPRARRDIDARRVAKVRRHSAVLTDVRAASAGGAGSGASAAPAREVAAYGRGLSRSLHSALVTRMTSAGSAAATAAACPSPRPTTARGAGAAVPNPRRVSIAATLRASAGGAAAAAAARSPRATAGRSGNSLSRRRATAVSDDDSENEFARRVTDVGAGMAEQRRRVTDAMAHTLRSLGGAAPSAAPEALTARSAGGAAAASTGGGRTGGGSSAGWYLTEVLAGGAAAGDEESEGPDAAVPEGGTPVQLSPSQRLPLSQVWARRNSQSRGGAPAGPRQSATPVSAGGAGGDLRSPRQTQSQQQRRTTAAASSVSAMDSSRRRLTFEDEVYPPPPSPGGYTAANASLSREDARLLAAMRSAAGDQQRLGMRATWAPVGSPSAGGAVAAAAAMDALATRISVPAAGLGGSTGASSGGADVVVGAGAGAGAASKSFGGAKESWAQRVFERVSQPGGRH
ncbi:hypothetical protein HYH02_011189 [Chlamydomonas schloesseri]|uniref:Uncharacterized protein n=1 Tax=Chlamydomonas schloesseri TaxID=2026947 RepID=A0A835W1X4_9CHLO|nr:hypothetical protein HYH02_011189 [Chlamydomonas schloesseri]|eukprot:KAG2437547.1 hypothetical protein HYH02_011189 [Chlamydomonas schloesseri]